MDYFRSRDGREIQPVDHIACFKGDNNRSKSMVLIWLMYNGGTFRTAKQLANDIGVNYNYIKARLMFWYRIRYVNRKLLIRNTGRPVWSYCIAERGRHFCVDIIPDDKFDEYLNSIKQYQLAKREREARWAAIKAARAVS